MADFVNDNGLPRELFEKLIQIYQLNEEIRMTKYMEDYKYEKDHKKNKLIKDKLAKTLAKEIDSIYSIKEKVNNYEYNYDYEKENDKPKTR